MKLSDKKLSEIMDICDRAVLTHSKDSIARGIRPITCLSFSSKEEKAIAAQYLGNARTALDDTKKFNYIQCVLHAEVTQDDMKAVRSNFTPRLSFYGDN